MGNKLYCNCYKSLAIIILFAGFILGIALGDYFSTTALGTDSFESVKTFNTEVMLIIWASTFMLSIFVLSVYSICLRQELIIENTKKSKNGNK